jgi:4-hydroxy-tetrahydrodipicolinate synthase
MKMLSGAWPTMVTPFDENLQIDVGVYRAMVEWYLDHNVGGMYANCLSSEMFHLRYEARLLLVREAVRCVNERVPVAATGNLDPTLAKQPYFGEML